MRGPLSFDPHGVMPLPLHSIALLLLLTLSVPVPPVHCSSSARCSTRTLLVTCTVRL
jgi:hypothetical protein